MVSITNGLLITVQTLERLRKVPRNGVLKVGVYVFQSVVLSLMTKTRGQRNPNKGITSKEVFCPNSRVILPSLSNYPYPPLRLLHKIYIYTKREEERERERKREQ